jgi:tetratricopeptide (TPR) repeat protein
VSEPRERMAARADALMDLERYEDAVKLWAEVIAADPSEARPHLRMASALRSLDRGREARAAVERALVLAPSEYAHRLRALILMDLSERHEAIRAARQAVRLGPRSYRAHTTLAQALLADRSLGPALEAVERAITLEPAEAWPWDIRGRITLKQKNYDLAAASFRKALALCPTDGYYHMTLANCLYDAGRHEECIEALRNSLRLDPTQVWVMAMLAYELATVGQTAEAAEMRAIAERTAGEDKERWRNLAMAGFRTRHRDDVIAAYRRVLALDPADGGAAIQLASMLGKKDEALAVLRTTVGHNPGHARLRCNYLSLMATLGNGAEALALGRARFAATGDREALIAAVLGLESKAHLPEVEAAIAGMPEDHEGLEMRATAAAIREDWPESERQYRRVLAIAPTCCCSWAGLARARFEQGDAAQARAYCQQARQENWACDCREVKDLEARLGLTRPGP